MTTGRDSEIDRVYAYWFGEAPAADADAARAKMRRWYMGGPSVDQEIRDQFGDLIERAQNNELDAWAETPRGRVALIILLDQFSRNVWRDQPRCYAGDPKAARLALEALDAGID